MNTAEYERQKGLIVARNLQNPIYRRLFAAVEQLDEVLEWTIDHIALPFTWPTLYNAPGQEHIVFDEDKVKVTLDVQNNNCDLAELGRAELQDIVLGWIRHIRMSFSEEQRQPVDFTPMAEYEMWRTLEIKYNTFLELLKHPFVRESIGKRYLFRLLVQFPGRGDEEKRRFSLFLEFLQINWQVSQVHRSRRRTKRSSVLMIWAPVRGQRVLWQQRPLNSHPG